MAARIPLGKALTASANGASIRIRLDDPPFLFVSPSTGSNGSAWTGSVYIQHSMDTPPMPNNGGGVANDGTTDANAVWTTIVTLNPGDEVDWRSPLYRIRVLTTGITGGSPNVYLLVGIRTLKTQWPPSRPARQYESQGGI